jgi:hypothetical protein
MSGCPNAGKGFDQGGLYGVEGILQDFP